MIRNGEIPPIDEILYKTLEVYWKWVSLRQYWDWVIWLVFSGGVGNLEAILIDLQRPNFGFEG